MSLSAHLSNDHIMSEFHALQPIFYEEDDDLQSCNSGSCLSEDMWKKFQLDTLTPPRSPEQEFSADLDDFSDGDDFANAFLNNPPTPISDLTTDNTYYVNPMLESPHSLPELKDACTEVFEHSGCDSYKLIKDCMWNGVGHKPHSEVRRHVRNPSPTTANCNPVTGCVNPRSVFTTAIGRRQCLSPRRMTTNRIVDGTETPSDSEEEIDVVTVEKKKSPSVIGRTTTLGVVSQGHKFVGTLVSRHNGGQQQLALVTTGGNRLQKSAEDKDSIRGRSQCKGSGQQTVTMLINNSKTIRNVSTTKPVNLQLKSLPIVTTSVGSNGLTTKRRYSSPADNRGDNSSKALMRLAPPSSLLSISTSTSTKENASPNRLEAASIGSKRKKMSLDGVSMVTDTGINRHRHGVSFNKSWIKTESVETMTLQPLQTSEPERVSITNSNILEKRKTTKKYTKPKVVAALASYESPTSSPDSSGSDSPASPKKRSVSGESSTSSSSSSGSDEESIRAAHNVLERQRREGLRASFHVLRKVVPELVEVERAPKVSILKKAREHALHLQDEAASLELEKSTLQQRQYALQQRLREMASEISLVNTVSYATTPVKCEVVDVADAFNVYVD